MSILTTNWSMNTLTDMTMGIMIMCTKPCRQVPTAIGTSMSLLRTATLMCQTHTMGTTIEHAVFALFFC